MRCLLCGLCLTLLVSCETMPGLPASYPADRPVVPLGGSKLVAARPGMLFNSTFVLENRTNGVRAVGTMRQIVTQYQDSQISSGIALVIDAESQNRTQNGNTLPPIAFTTSSVYVNDAQGYPSLVVARATNGVTKYVMTPAGGYQSWPTGGSLLVGDGVTAGPVQFSDASSQTCNYIVTGIEVIDTPLARFETYRFDWSCTFNNPGSVAISNFTSWVHPAIGEVKSTITTQDSVGFTIMTIEMTSTNVPF